MRRVQTWKIVIIDPSVVVVAGRSSLNSCETDRLRCVIHHTQRVKTPCMCYGSDGTHCRKPDKLSCPTFPVSFEKKTETATGWMLMPSSELSIRAH